MNRQKIKIFIFDFTNAHNIEESVNSFLSNPNVKFVDHRICEIHSRLFFSLVYEELKTDKTETSLESEKSENTNVDENPFKIPFMFDVD